MNFFFSISPFSLRPGRASFLSLALSEGGERSGRRASKHGSPVFFVHAAGVDWMWESRSVEKCLERIFIRWLAHFVSVQHLSSHKKLHQSHWLNESSPQPSFQVNPASRHCFESSTQQISFINFLACQTVKAQKRRWYKMRERLVKGMALLHYRAEDRDQNWMVFRRRQASHLSFASNRSPSRWMDEAQPFRMWSMVRHLSCDEMRCFVLFRWYLSTSLRFQPRLALLSPHSHFRSRFGKHSNKTNYCFDTENISKIHKNTCSRQSSVAASWKAKNKLALYLSSHGLALWRFPATWIYLLQWCNVKFLFAFYLRAIRWLQGWRMRGNWSFVVSIMISDCLMHADSSNRWILFSTSG